MDSSEYIVTAKKLLSSAPTDVDVRRAVSATYYAMFHHVSRRFSDIVLRPSSSAYNRAWIQAYRYIDHGPAKQRCIEVWRQGRDFSIEFQIFAEMFARLQDRRNDADYNPLARLTVAGAEALIADAEVALAAFDTALPEAQRAFVLFIGLRPKGR
jgi:uncharacterized protein (UPF0332 family)